MNLTLYSLAYPVTALGPGARVVLWVAGCQKRCDGCISPEMLAPAAGQPVPIPVLLRRLMSLEPQLDGLTISGGEPFDQSGALVVLLRDLRQLRPAWNVIVYSGYTLQEICCDMTGRAELLNYVDVLIDGPFRKEIPPKFALTGSGNQTIHYLTARGQSLRSAVESFPPGQINWGIGAGSHDMLIGVADERARDMACNALRAGKPDTKCPGEPEC